MFSHQFLIARQAALAWAGLVGAFALSGCSLFTHGQRETAVAPPPPVAVAADTTTTSQPQTVTEALGEAPEDGGTTTVMADAGPALKPGAPKSYVVQRGDTLWGIANMFLRDAWLWPEIWYVNPEIHNPHRIYPGDTVRLALGSDGKAMLQVVQGSAGAAARLEPLLRSTPLEGPIATIPYSVIAAFLSRPGVLTGDEVKAAPYILALRDEHIVAGAGHELYVKKLAGETGARYSVMHVDEPLKDPESGHKLGYLAIYTGTAQLTRPGEIAKATLTDSARETLQGDVLIPEQESPSTDFAPHAPVSPVSGQVIAVVDNVLLAGQYEVVALNRGSHDGLERGNVLTVDQASSRVSDRCARIEGNSTCLRHPTQTLPTESAGTLLVFKTYEHMSYALILSETAPIHVFDRARNP